MSELGLRKVSHKEFVSTVQNKRAKTDNNDAEEVSSEDAGSEPDAASDRLQRMAAAMRTVIEVSCDCTSCWSKMLCIL